VAMRGAVAARLRRALVPAAKLTVSVGLLAFLLHKAGLPALASAARSASLPWIVLALVLGLLATAAQTGQWRALLRAIGMPRSWLRCLRLVFVGNTFNTILPSSIGGDVVRAAMVADAPDERVSALTTVVLQRLCNFPGMIVIMGAGVLLTLGNHEADRARPIATLGVVAGVAGLVICTTPLLGWLAQRRLVHVVRLNGVLQKLHDFRVERRVLLLASGRGTAFWSLTVLNQWAFMHAVGIPISIPYAAVVATTVNAITMLPISINGYGVRDGGFVALLAGLVAPSAALAASFCLAGQSLLWALIGLPFAVTNRRRATPSAVATVAAARAA